MEPLIEKLPRLGNRAMASFIVDDLGPATPQDAEAFRRFSQAVQQAGLKGECSVILGLKRSEEGKALSLPAGFVPELIAARGHLDAFMEVMTHSFLYDFAADRIRADGPHEGAWLHDRSRGLEEYDQYFRRIAARAAAEGFRHAGLTLPGCGCPACAEFFARNRLGSKACELNPRVFQALLGLAAEGLLAAPVCPLFVGWDGQGPADAHVLAERDAFGVYDTPPGVQGDHFGRWDNDPARQNIDAYITQDGQGGRLPQLLSQGTQTLIYYGHWQSLRPDTGVGFRAFLEVAERLRRHHADRIVWMRPSEIAAYRHTERHTELRAGRDGRSFELRIPFPALRAITFRVRGGSGIRIRTPGGGILSPSEKTAGGLLFDLVPESGRYEMAE